MKESLKIPLLIVSLLSVSAITFFSFGYFVKEEYEHPETPFGIYLEKGNPRTSDYAHNAYMNWSKTKTYADVGRFVVGALIYTPSLISFLLILSLIGEVIKKLFD